MGRHGIGIRKGPDQHAGVGDNPALCSCNFALKVALLLQQRAPARPSSGCDPLAAAMAMPPHLCQSFGVTPRHPLLDQGVVRPHSRGHLYGPVNTR